MTQKRAVTRPVPSDEARLKAADRYSWYIMNALRYRIRETEKQVKLAKDRIAVLGDDRDSAIAVSTENLIDHAEHMIRDYQRALDALEMAGFK